MFVGCPVQFRLKFPISRDPPEGGTRLLRLGHLRRPIPGFQFLGIPPKGELLNDINPRLINFYRFQFLGIPPKGKQEILKGDVEREYAKFPISRDPPEGGTLLLSKPMGLKGLSRFQFLGIPPKGERF